MLSLSAIPAKQASAALEMEKQRSGGDDVESIHAACKGAGMETQ